MVPDFHIGGGILDNKAASQDAPEAAGVATVQNGPRSVDEGTPVDCHDHTECNVGSNVRMAAMAANTACGIRSLELPSRMVMCTRNIILSIAVIHGTPKTTLIPSVLVVYRAPIRLILLCHPEISKRRGDECNGEVGEVGEELR